MRSRQHVNPLGLGFTEYRDEVPVLDPSRPVEVEIGCAEAQFLIERWQRKPEGQYFGLEIRDVMIRRANRRAQAMGSNVRVLFCHANHHLSSVFAPNTVDVVHLLFPDPWFKKRQQKRRVVTNDLVRDIHTVLKPTGELHFASDVWQVALAAMDVFERAEELFENRRGAWTFWKDGNPYGARSWREANCDAEGMKVWRILYRPRTIPLR